MTDRIMSDAEIKRRKKLQGHISQTTSTLGLTGLALLGTGAAIKRKPGLLKKIPAFAEHKPEHLAEKGHKLGEKAKTVGVISGGVGGVGGYNFAAYTNAESRKRKPIVKSHDMDSVYGEVAKAWSPTGPQFDAEERRHKRNVAAEMTTGAVGGATTGVGALKAMEGAGQKGRGLRQKAEEIKGTNGVSNVARYRRGLKNIATGSRKMRTGAKVMGAGAAGVLASDYIHHKRKSGDWESYSKSAFGITHDG